MALENLKVLDLTRVLAGPFATMVLGDLGADVIKVEMPVKGDDARHFGPYLHDESAYFISLNRNKRSITLNLKAEEGKKLLLEMVKNVDVLVENYRPGTMEKLGLGYDVLKEVNPKLIYAAVSGYGHSGPFMEKPAYDAVVQALGGIMSITGHDRPTRVGTSVGDIVAGLYGAIGILAAVNTRHETGKGQKVDVAMLDSQVAILENAIARYVVSGEIPEPGGNKHPSIVPFEDFDTKDDKIMLAVGNDALWACYSRVVGREDLIDDERFKTNPLRNENYDQLKPILDEIMAEKTTAEWQELFDEAGVPNGPINSVDKVLDHPQVKAREMILEIDHPVEGSIKVPGIPVKLSETPGQIKRTAPLLGEHKNEILRELLNYDEDKIKELEEAGIF